MLRWCQTLTLVAAIAAMATGCAHESGVRWSQSAAALPPAADAATDNAADARVKEKEIARAAMPDVRRAAMQIQDGLARLESAEATPALPADGQPPKLTLEYLSRLAMENHPLLRRDVARIDSAGGQALQAGLYPNPRFDTNNPQVFNGPNSAFNVGFQQDIVVKGKLRLDRAAALRGQQQTEYAFVQDRYALLAQVRNQFYQTLAAQYRVDVLTRLLKITELSVTIATELLKISETKTEELLLEIDFNRVQADLLSAQRILAGEREQLAAIVGFPGLVDEKVIGSLEAPPPLFDDVFTRQFVSSENAQVQIAKLDIDKNRILLKRAEAEPYPNITLGPAYQYGINKQQEQYWMTIVFPIPVSDRNQGNIVSARANIKDSTETLGAVQLELLRRLAETLSVHRAAVEQAERYKTQIIPDGQKALKLARSGLRAGVLEFSTYLQTQRTVIDATKEYVDILEKVWTTASDLSGLLQMDQFP